MSSDASLPLTGGCGCGAVRFELSAPPVAAVYCHCTRCQRRTGTSSAASAPKGSSSSAGRGVVAASAGGSVAVSVSAAMLNIMPLTR